VRTLRIAKIHKREKKHGGGATLEEQVVNGTCAKEKKSIAGRGGRVVGGVEEDYSAVDPDSSLEMSNNASDQTLSGGRTGGKRRARGATDVLGGDVERPYERGQKSGVKAGPMQTGAITGRVLKFAPTGTQNVRAGNLHGQVFQKNRFRGPVIRITNAWEGGQDRILYKSVQTFQETAEDFPLGNRKTS